MSESKQNANVLRKKITHIVFTVLLICMTCASSSLAQDGPTSWFKWIFALFSADDVPQRPVLTEQDRLAIEKAKVLLGSYTPDTANSLMLGLLAAADGNETEALRHLFRTHKLDSSSSLLPLTMAAQTYVQQGNYKVAKRMHQRILTQTSNRDASPISQKINAHLDLAVACSNLNEHEQAKSNVKKAEQLISTSTMKESEKALAYLQSGIVYNTSIKDSNEAVRLWVKGQLLTEKVGSRLDPRLTLQLNLNVVENLPHMAPLTVRKKYLKNAEKAANRLAGDSKVVAQMRIGTQFKNLAVQRMATPDAPGLSREAKRLLEPARQIKLEGISHQMIRVKARAIEAQKTLAEMEKDTTNAKRLKDETEKVKNRAYIFIKQSTPVKKPAIQRRRDIRKSVDPVRKIP